MPGLLAINSKLKAAGLVGDFERSSQRSSGFEQVRESIWEFGCS